MLAHTLYWGSFANANGWINTLHKNCAGHQIRPRNIVLKVAIGLLLVGVP
jgi:hypothetical protein